MERYQELHRPQFHFSAQEGWINDPNGLIYADGRWHLFFQLNPNGTIWGDMTWGHAVSDDLLHWRQGENALHPDEMGTMFSGSGIVDHDNTAGFGAGAQLLFYTAAGDYAEPKQPFTQCLAYSTDSGDSWTKYDGNPVVDHFEKGNRDPKVIWHAPSKAWIMALYLADNRYCLLRSTNARDWTRFQDLTLEGVSECPDFFPMTDEAGEERWVFWGALGRYLIGRFDDEAFTPETDAQTCEYGAHGYAAQTWSNVPDGRTLQISWMAGGLYPEMPFNQQLSIPVELSLSGSGTDVALTRSPVRELTALQTRTVTAPDQTLKQRDSLIPDTQCPLMDVSFTVTPSEAASLFVIIRGQTARFDWENRELTFTKPGNKVMGDLGTVPLPASDRISIRMIIDKTSMEVFIDEGRTSASFCFLPDGHLHVFEMTNWSKGEQRIEQFELHELSRVWDG